MHNFQLFVTLIRNAETRPMSQVEYICHRLLLTAHGVLLTQTRKTLKVPEKYSVLGSPSEIGPLSMAYWSHWLLALLMSMSLS